MSRGTSSGVSDFIHLDENLQRIEEASASRSFNQKTYDALKKAFEDVAKKIANYEEERALPSDENKRKLRISGYKSETVETYNNFVEYIDTFYSTFGPDSKARVNQKIGACKLKVLRSLTILGLKTDLPDQHERIRLENVVEIGFEEPDDTQIFFNPSSARVQIPGGGDNSDTHTVGGAHTNQTENQVVNAVVSNQTVEDQIIQPIIPNDDPERQIDAMALTLSDVMRGIPKFLETDDGIQQFIAESELMYDLSEGTVKTTALRIIKTRLATAHKLGDIGNDTWLQIKTKLREKYRNTMTYETAQERLLAIRQGPKESLETYSDRVKKLLDSLNIASVNEDPNVQSATRAMNEELAVRKFKQNIFDEKVRTMALSTDHRSLFEAIAHATQKQEQMQSSNIVKDQKTEQKEANKSQNNNGGYNNKKPQNFKKAVCLHCKKPGHSPDRCFFKPKNNGEPQKVQANGQNLQNRPQRAANAAKATKTMSASSQENASQSEEEQTYEAHVSSSAARGQFQLEPLHLNSERWMHD